MSHQIDRPPIDTSRRPDDAAGSGLLVNPLMGMNDCSPSSRPGEAEALGEGQDRPMIKPSTHQRVAIRVHRQDWP
jgi:hypothetical protein